MSQSLCQMLNVDYPLVQAGMAGGATTVDLVASVSESGALGTLGAAYMKPEEIREAIKGIKVKTVRPFAVNLFCTSMVDDFSNLQQVETILNVFREDLKIGNKVEQYQTGDYFEEQFQVLLDEEVPIISTAFGLIPKDKVAILKKRDVKIISMVTTVREALLAEEHGADIIVAQGSDAGGHRSTFDMKEQPNGANIGTFSLIPQVVDHVNVPVIAAGGIMDGRGMLAAMALGAQGIQMGTQFLTSKESGIHSAYKAALYASTEESTVLTKSFSGRPARGIKNHFVESFEESGVSPLPFPSQNTITSSIRKAAAEQSNPDYMSLWSGQATRLLKESQSAKDIIEEVMEEYHQALKMVKTNDFLKNN
ncbi:nitronate monooxygenase [Bacillus sp. UMB0899]|nr:nitronate monooxygenase [Bacillus sp. UMB0899]